MISSTPFVNVLSGRKELRNQPLHQSILTT